ncbi:BrnT family toxin [Candidatus Margulisiibacteriota bacterium]
MDINNSINGFEWDKGNINKNWDKHGVNDAECEQIFFNIPLFIDQDVIHSHNEDRFYCLGQTDNNRLLFIIFTIRNDKIRIISARSMNRKERIIYDKLKKDTKI